MKPLPTGAFLLLMHIASGIYAQGFDGKIIVGLSAAQIDGDRIWGYNKLGPLLGAATSIQIGKKSALQLEIAYSQRGCSSTGNDLYFVRVLMQYVDIPLLYIYHITKKWNILGGLTTAYLLKSEYDGTGYGYVTMTDQLMRYDFCFSAGTEYYLTAKWALHLQFNYSALPINDFSRNNTSNFLVNGGWFNNYMSLSIRYTLWNGIGHKEK